MLIVSLINTRRYSILLVLVILFSLGSCKHEPEEMNTNVIPNPNDSIINGVSCDPDSVYFQNDVFPILISGCAKSGCHDAASAEEDVILTSFQSIINTGEIVPGDPSESKLYEAITENDPEKRMPPPPNAPLTTEQILIIRKWIEQGAKNNYCTSECDTNNFRFQTAIQPMINTNCKGCHNAIQASGGIRLDDYNSVKAVAENGKLIATIKHDPGYSPMPKGGNKLSDCKITQVRKWIADGAPDN